jgi:SAM-dependent methyltransferase
MTLASSHKRQLSHEIEASSSAPDIAAAAALLEIGDRLGLLDLIGSGEQFSVATLAEAGQLPEVGIANYIEALESAAIIEPLTINRDVFRAVADFSIIQHRAGYVSWTMNANRPFIENAREFLSNPDSAGLMYHRDGRQVAVSSQWMGSLAFYPAAFEAIADTKPERVSDLGAGTCRLLIDLLTEFPGATAVGLDIDAAACQAARSAAGQTGVGDRLTVLERSIQSVATDPSPIKDADVIHAGFVFHDMMPEEETTADAVLANCRDSLRDGGIMAITEAVPYIRNPRERRFSSIVSYYHKQFMKRKLLSESEWERKLLDAGFGHVDIVELGFPTGRLFLAHK